jgi:hypothetical protein
MFARRIIACIWPRILKHGSFKEKSIFGNNFFNLFINLTFII